MASQTPCTACSWTPERQNFCGYHSNVKLFYERGDRGTWSIGSQLILKERSNDAPNFEAQNMGFLKEKTSIPVPTIVEEWGEDNGRYFIVTKRIPGKPLKEVWSTMTDEEKNRVAKQTANYLHQLRELHSPRMQSLGERPLYCAYLFGGDYGVPHGPISSDDELWAEIETELSAVPEKVRQQLRERMPTAAPYTFTHGNLTNETIIVKDGNLTGITQWVSSGYFPVWWESANAHIGQNDEEEWKGLLLKYMPGHTDASNFWLDFYCLTRPDVNSERRRKILEGLD